MALCLVLVNLLIDFLHKQAYNNDITLLHGIDFETAMLVFNDLQRIEIYDTEHSIYEDCYNTIGMVNDVLFVVYTERKQNIRLISARLANNTERSIYYDTDSYFG